MSAHRAKLRTINAVLRVPELDGGADLLELEELRGEVVANEATGVRVGRVDHLARILT